VQVPNTIFKNTAIPEFRYTIFKKIPTLPVTVLKSTEEHHRITFVHGTSHLCWHAMSKKFNNLKIETILFIFQ